MGRLAVILGSNALGPGGEEIAAAAAEHGAAIVQRHGADGEPYVLPHLIDHEANLRPLLEQGCDRVLAIGSVGSLRAELAGRQPSSAPTTSSPSTSATRSSATPAPTRRRASTPRWRAEVIAAWGERRPGAARRRRLLAGDRAALRDPGRDPADGRARRRGRDDDRLRVRRRRRARPRLRGALRRRQPRQRPRRRAGSASPAMEADRARQRRAPARRAWRRCCRGWARSGR